MKAKYLLVGVLFLFFIAVVMSPVAGEPPANVSPVVTRTATTETTCYDGACNTVLYSGTMFAFEDNEWKDIKDAKSLKGVWDVIIDEDEDYPVDVIDFNYTSITLNLSVADKHLNKDIDLKVYDKHNKTEKPKDEFGVIKDKDKKIKVNGEKVKYTIDLSDTVESILGQEIRWGKSSTVIQINTTSDDGYIYNNSATWDLAHDALTGTVDNTGDLMAAFSKLKSPTFTPMISRAFLIFDTSSIPDGATITDAIISFKMLDAVRTIGLVQTNQSGTSIAESDYDNCGAVDSPEEGAPRFKPTDGWNTFTLNATGIAWINKTGYTKLGIRDDNDLNDTSTGLNVYEENYIYSYESGDSPYINITYTPPPYTISGYPILTDGLNNYTNDTLYGEVKCGDDNTSLPALTYDIQWFKNGTNQSSIAYWNISIANATAANTTLTSGNTTKGDGWIVSYRCSDETLFSSWSNSTTLYVRNAPPDTTIATLNATTTLNQSNETLTCWNGSVNDINNDAVIIYYRWYKNNSLIIGGENLSALASGNTTKGDNWTCEAIPTDSWNNATGTNTTELYVHNLPPTINQPRIGAHIAPNSSGMPVYFTFEHNTSPVPDDSGNGRTGALTSVNWIREGAIGEAYNHSGVKASKITISHNELLSINKSGQIAISLWLKWWSPPITDSIFNKGLCMGAPSACEYNYYNLGGMDNFRIGNGTDDAGIGIGMDEENISWHHYVFMYSNETDNVTVFLDGVLNATAEDVNISLAANTDDLVLGGGSFGGFQGTIDEFVIYNRTLTASEIYETYLNAIQNGSAQAYTNQNISCAPVDARDADGDVIIYQIKWFKNDTQQPALENATTITLDNTTKGDNWTCEITPMDGDIGVSMNSTGIYIEDSQPTVSLVELVADNLGDNVNITLNITVDDIDDDMDSCIFSTYSDLISSNNYSILDIGDTLANSGYVTCNDTDNKTFNFLVNFTINNVSVVQSSTTSTIVTQYIKKNDTLFNNDSLNPLKYNITHYTPTAATLTSGGEFTGTLTTSGSAEIYSEWSGDWLNDTYFNWSQDTTKNTTVNGTAYLKRNMNCTSNISIGFTGVDTLYSTYCRAGWACVGTSTIDITANGETYTNNIVNASKSNVITSARTIFQSNNQISGANVNWSREENWTNNDASFGFLYINQTINLPTDCSDVETFINGTNYTGQTEVVSASGCQVNITWNQTLLAGVYLDPEINYSTSGVIITKGATIQSSSPQIGYQANMTRTDTSYNPGTQNYTNMTLKFIIPTDTATGSIKIRDANKNLCPYSQSCETPIPNIAGGYVNVTIPNITSGETKSWYIEYNTSRINYTQENATTATEFFEYLNVTFNASTISNVLAFLWVNESIITPSLFLLSAGTWVDKTTDAGYSYTLSDTDGDGLNDYATWYIQSLNANKTFRVSGTLGIPISYIENATIINPPATPNKILLWENEINFTNENPTSQNFSQKIRPPDDARNIKLNDVAVETYWDVNGRYMVVEDTLAANTSTIHNVTYSTDAITERLFYRYRDTYWVGEDGVVSINVSLRNWVAEAIEEWQEAVTVQYGEELYLCDDYVFECNESISTIDHKKIVSGMYTIEGTDFPANSEKKYTISYRFPTVAMEEQRKYKEVINGSLFTVIPFTFTSIAPLPLNKVKAMVETIGYDDVKKIIDLTGREYGYESGSLVIDLESFNMNEVKRVFVYLKAEVEPETDWLKDFFGYMLFDMGWGGLLTIGHLFIFAGVIALIYVGARFEFYPNRRRLKGKGDI